MTERQEALRIANRILDRPNGDPDDDLAILARQLIRVSESAKNALEMQMKYCSNGMCHTDVVKFLESL
jgi:hypothetical protein